jgi:hypothetical protein
MKKLIAICLVCVCVTSIAATQTNPWPDAKMHYPQLPDPQGWDIAFSPGVFLADDWQCSETGLVKDVHFWVSFKGDFIPPEEFEGPTFGIGIFADIPAVEGSPSHPGQYLWGKIIGPGQYEGEDAGTGQQGWFNPATNETIYPDHLNYYLISIDLSNESDLFKQQKDTIYWLGIILNQPFPENYQVGWKTSGSPHFMDDAVWSSDAAGRGELVYPSSDPLERGGQSIDLAFVITPEPTTICLLGFGALSLIRRKK